MVGPKADQRNAQSAGRQALPLLERRVASETAKMGQWLYLPFHLHMAKSLSVIS
uniref:Uncharacterized protein n=1 Tax=Pseudomonas syringae pv. actinidiae TaxID=103796 RepID=A0A2P0QGH1_PSESF|nr:hypothetical protein [Pseudomonas syringae pv. actinidiae]